MGVRILVKHLCFLKPVMCYRQVIRCVHFPGDGVCSFPSDFQKGPLPYEAKSTIVVSFRFWGEHLTVLGVSELEQGDYGALVTGV